MLDELLSQNSIFEKNSINSLINKDINRKGGMERIFSLLQLSLWAKQHSITF